MLEETLRFARLGQEAALRLPKGHIHKADLWILAHGFAAASMSLNERLNKIDKGRDDDLKAAINEWQEDNREILEMRSGQLRRSTYHQGKQFTAIPTTEWDGSIDHDTVFPRSSNVFAEIVSVDGTRREVSFQDWANELFWWWQRELNDILRIYRSKTRNKT